MSRVGGRAADTAGAASCSLPAGLAGGEPVDPKTGHVVTAGPVADPQSHGKSRPCQRLHVGHDVTKR
jgi:hypothetical protein